jgi:hypothetical protein
MCCCEQSIPPAFNVGHTKKAPLFLGECRGGVHSSHCTIKYSSYLILLAAKVSLMSPASPLLSAWYKSPVVHVIVGKQNCFPRQDSCLNLQHSKSGSKSSGQKVREGFMGCLPPPPLRYTITILVHITNHNLVHAH